MIYFNEMFVSELIGRPVIDRTEEKLAVVKDVVIESGEQFPRVIGLLAKVENDKSDKVILLRRKADIRIKDQWTDHLKWMVDAVVRLRKVFGPRIKALQLESMANDVSTVEADEGEKRG